jgi:hypothetical protein
VTDGRFVRTKVAAQGHIRTGTLESECRGERLDRRAKQSCQNIRALGRLRLPGSDEIAAGPELAEWLSLFFSVWYHIFLIPGFQKFFKFV